MITLKSLLGGEWQAGRGEPAVLVNPSTEEPLALASTEGLDFGGAVDFARATGGPALRDLTFAERAGALKAMAGVLHEHRDELLDIAMRNGGNTRGDDTSFVGFGYRDTGLSFAPRLSNIHVWRLGASFIPFEEIALRTLTLTVYYRYGRCYGAG